jgi:chromate transporter
MAETTRAGSAAAVFWTTLRLGLSGAGAREAQVARVRRDVVERRGWLGDDEFADLAAFAGLLPGPPAGLLAMAVGLRRAGPMGLIAAWLAFAAPAAAAMAALAQAAPWLARHFGNGWRHGLALAAAGLVAHALVGQARTVLRSPVSVGMALGAAGGLLLAHGGPAAIMLALLAGGGFGFVLLREPLADAPPPAPIVLERARLACPAAVVLLLAVLPFAAAALGDARLGLASVAFRAGALAFGGGHLVLPLLHADVVEQHWLGRDAFLAAYGAAQALPAAPYGFAAYVGDAVGGGVGALVAVVAMSLPGLLLVAGAPPVERLKAAPGVAGAGKGVAAAAAGILAAALWSPLLSGAVRRPGDWALVAAAYVFVAVARLPAWLVVAGFAVATGILT